MKENDVRVHIRWIEAEDVTKEAAGGLFSGVRWHSWCLEGVLATGE